MSPKINKIFNKELNRFIAVGISTVLIDIIIYFVLLYFKFGISFAKALSFFGGTIYSYFINKKWTFNAIGSKKVFLFYITLYTVSMKINITVNSLIINLFINKNIMSILISFLISTLFSASFNFLCLKYCIFRKQIN
tara:strand:+ start:2623 stop:3033 length:411 start_codon:yes stop_codon:yes gene_type:complete